MVAAIVVKLPTDYAAHDGLYKMRRAIGEPGWDSEKTTKENIELLSRLGDSGWLGEPSSLLELGCGAGNLTRWFATQGWRAHGIDISPTAIQWAKDHEARPSQGITYQAADILTLDATRRYDLVFDGHCFHCIIGPDRRRFLEFARDSLLSSGRLLIMSMCGDFPEGVGRGHFDEASRCQFIDGAATRYIGHPDSIADEIQFSGLEITKSRIVHRRHRTDTDQIIIVAKRSRWH